MTPHSNEFGQPVGPPLPNWTPPPLPPRATMLGRLCRLEPLEPTAHAADLYAALSTADARSWTYLAYGPFASFAFFDDWLGTSATSSDPLFYSIIDAATGKASGLASYLRIAPNAGSIEVGHLHFSPALRQRPAATEAMVLMMRWAFEAGYRRYEWKCDSLNAASRRAAERLGFTYEGTFRQATVYKGRSRDTAWYAVIDADWPRLRTAYDTWLASDNFDDAGRQRIPLSKLTQKSD